MKPGFLLCAVIMCLNAGNVIAQENASSETTQYQLELSKKLTLNPAGTPPQLSPPLDTPPRSRALFTALLIGAGLLGSWFAYRRGQNNSRRVSPVALRSIEHDNEIATLKSALMESGSGHRREWDSTLATFRNDVATKNRRIDELIDENAARDKLAAAREQELRDMEDSAAAFQAANDRELDDLRTSLDTLQQQFEDVSTRLKTAQSELASSTSLNTKKSQQIAQLESSLTDLTQEFTASTQELNDRHQHTESLYLESATALAAAQQGTQDQQQTIEQLESSLANLTEDYETSTQGLNDQYQQTQSLYRDSAAELNAAQQRLEDQQQTIEKLESSLTEVSQEFEGAAAQWEDQQGQAQSLLHTAEAEVSGSAARIRDQETTIERLEASLAGLKLEFDEATAAWKEKDEQVDAQLHTAEAEVAGSAAQIQDQQTTIERLEASLAELHLEFESAAAAWEDKQKQTQSLLHAAETDASSGAAQIQDQQTTIERLEASLAELHLEFESAAAAWEDKQKQTQSLLHAAETDASSGAAQIQDQQTTIERLEASLAELHQEFAKAVEEREESQTQVQSQLHAAEAEVSSGATQIREQQLTIEQLEHSMAELTRQYDSSTAELAEKNSRAEAQMQTAETELSSARQKTSTQERMIAQLESSRADLSREFAESRAQIRELKEQHDQHIAVHKTTAADLDSATQRAQDQQLIIDELESSLAEITGSLQAASANLQEQQNHTRQLERERDDDLKASAERIDKQQQSIEQLENELAAVRQHLAEKDDAITQQRREYTSLKEEYDAITDTLAARQEEHLAILGQHETDLQSARSELGTLPELREQFAAVEAQKSELVDQLTAATEERRLAQAAREESLTHAAQVTQQLEAAATDKNDLEKQIAALARELENSSTAPADQHQYAQAQQQLDTAVAQNVRLESQLEILQNQYDDLQTELDEPGSKLRERGESNSSSEGRIAQLIEENRQLSAKVQALDEHEAAFAETITDLESRLGQSEQIQLHSAQQLSNTTQEAQRELQQKAAKLELTSAERDALYNKLERLQARLSKAEEHMHEKDMKTLRVGSELVEYKTRQEQYLQDIAALEAQLHAQKAADRKLQTLSEVQELQDALRARENIVGALEQQLNASEATIERMKGDVEHLELAAVAHEHDYPADADDADQATGSDSDLLQQQLVEKIHHITRLEAELKVSNDLVHVFESDSNQLQKAEIELEALHESNAFLQNELATTVNEVASLKVALSKSSSYAERQQRLGRGPATSPPNQD